MEPKSPTQVQIELLAKNEREWRQFMIQKIQDVSVKVDHIDKELSSFKIKVFGFASIFGGATGLSAEYIKNFFVGQ